MSRDCHVFDISEPFTLAELLAETRRVLGRLLGPVRLPALTITDDAEFARRHRLAAVPDWPAMGDVSITGEVRLLRVHLDQRPGNGLFFGTAQTPTGERPGCVVSPERTPVGWTVGVAMCLAGAQLGRGRYGDERGAAPTLGLHEPEAIITATAITLPSASFDDACAAWDAAFIEPM